MRSGNPGNPGNPLVNAVPSKVNRVKLLGNPGNPVNTEKANVVRQRFLNKVNTVPSKVNTLSTVEIDHSAHEWSPAPLPEAFPSTTL